MNDPIRVLVTAVSGGSVGGQVCKALRAGRRRYEIVGANTVKSVIASVHTERQVLLPPGSSSGYLEALLAVVRECAADFVIPGSEQELLVVAQNGAAVVEAGATPLVNTFDVVATCTNKARSADRLTALGFRTPATAMLSSPAEADSIGIPPPWIVKPVEGGGGSASASIAQDPAELRFFVEYLLKYGQHPLVQEYVGVATEEYTVGVLHSPAGQLIGAIALQRQILGGLSNRLRVPNHTGRAELGPVLAISSGISQGRILDAPEVLATAEAIAQALGSVGPLNIQGRLDRGSFVPFEINPRFSGTSPMRAMAGFNEPELLIDWHLEPDRRGRSQPVPIYGDFTRALVEHFEPLGPRDGGH